VVICVVLLDHRFVLLVKDANLLLTIEITDYSSVQFSINLQEICSSFHVDAAVFTLFVLLSINR